MATKMQIQYAGYALQNPGDFRYIFGLVDGLAEPTHIIFINPKCRLGSCQIPIKRGPPDNAAHKWGWDGNMETPTLTPSIGCDHRCGWHGHITNGEITP